MTRGALTQHLWQKAYIKPQQEQRTGKPQYLVIYSDRTAKGPTPHAAILRLADQIIAEEYHRLFFS